ncbi:Ser/Thr protein phosphatase [Histomonas meleagridis]|uniref:Ser/Thr protein phosphatase n=1 Tax=Histomonas meleagridis TaxID=135588 RepID=UPI00355A9E62|nr:Ser/Thr protein phosphatase [Histomonas meleagridis]KAH0798090.1 Ser/Thr protein phosphatase [Histomonas meleagridis]
MQLLFPQHIYLLRGNHEFEAINDFYGFHSECINNYKSQVLYDSFNTAFDNLPIAAIIDQKIFCVHGGLSPLLTSFTQISTMPKPLKSYDSDLVSDLVWSDPSTENPRYVQSQRGTGVMFGTEAVNDFLETFSLKHIIRAHQCVPMGISCFGGNNLYTVFSCSNYSEGNGNRCGLMFVSHDLDVQVFSLPPVAQLDRRTCAMEKYPPKGFTLTMKKPSLTVTSKKMKSMSNGACKNSSMEKMCLLTRNLQPKQIVPTPLNSKRNVLAK